MSNGLPQRIDPLKMADQGRSFQGQIALGEMARLVAAVHRVEGVAEVTLAFARDEQGRRIVSGRVRASLQMVCQRCLEPVTVVLDQPVGLAVVHSQSEAARLPREYDPLLHEDDGVSLRELVEDELLLALPCIPVHPLGECGALMNEINREADQAEAGEKQNPFAVLGSLKKGSRSS
jgi:uncharacterized protein